MLFNLDNIDKKDFAADPLSQSTKNRQAAKACKTWQKLSDAIGKIESGRDIHFTTAAYWSTHDLVRYISEQIGPCKITACTWSFSQPGITQLVRMFNDGLVTEASFLVDWRIKLKVSDALALLKRVCSRFRISHCHAKVTVLESAKATVTIVGSANWTNNPRIESGVISTDPKIAEFHKEWINAEINNTDPLQKDFDPAEIPDAPQDTVAKADKNFIVIRGLPGSGKTTIASLFPDAVICEDDQFFTKNGLYRFEQRKTGEAAKHTQSKLLNAMKDEAPTVILSNVSADPKHFGKYIEMAQKYGYKTHSIIAENRQNTQNEHGVSAIEIDAIRQKFEVQL